MKINKEKISKFIKTLFVLGVIIGATWLSSFLIIKGDEEEIKSNYIEPYCAVRYKYDVEEYKKCTELNLQELIKKLTDEEAKKYDVPKLPMLRG